MANQLEEARRASAPKARIGSAPEVGVVLGSGLGALADSLGGLVKIPYAEIPHMPASAVVGHAGNLCFGERRATSASCACRVASTSTRGTRSRRSCFGVRLLARLGCKAVVLTNAAGGIDADAFRRAT